MPVLAVLATTCWQQEPARACTQPWAGHRCLSSIPRNASLSSQFNVLVGALNGKETGLIALLTITRCSLWAGAAGQRGNSCSICGVDKLGLPGYTAEPGREVAHAAEEPSGAQHASRGIACAASLVCHEVKKRSLEAVLPVCFSCSRLCTIDLGLVCVPNFIFESCNKHKLGRLKCCLLLLTCCRLHQEETPHCSM